MEAGKPSQTALMVAALRARHFIDAPKPKILKDSLAATVSGLGTHDQIRSYLGMIEKSLATMSDTETAELFVKNIEYSVCARARLVEEELVTAKLKGATQFIILGAGLDTTAYREIDLCSGINVFEVDHPDSQSWKLQQLSDAKIPIPKNLKFVPFDFENTTLMKALSDGGVSTDAITVFSWLGVQMYLTDKAVKETIKVVSSFPPKSSLIMDFVQPEYKEVVSESDSLDRLRKIVSGMGEPLLSAYSVPELNAVFKDLGLSDSSFPTIGEFTHKYMSSDYDMKMSDKAQFLAIGRV